MLSLVFFICFVTVIQILETLSSQHTKYKIKNKQINEIKTNKQTNGYKKISNFTLRECSVLCTMLFLFKTTKG